MDYNKTLISSTVNKKIDNIVDNWVETSFKRKEKLEWEKRALIHKKHKSQKKLINKVTKHIKYAAASMIILSTLFLNGHSLSVHTLAVQCDGILNDTDINICNVSQQSYLSLSKTPAENNESTVSNTVLRNDDSICDKDVSITPVLNTSSKDNDENNIMQKNEDERKAYTGTDTLVHTEDNLSKEKEFVCLDNIINCDNTDINNEYINQANMYLNKLPDNIKNKLKDWTIYITDDDLAIRYGYPTPILALTIYDTKEIYVCSSGEPSSLLHEVGHAFDYITNMPSLTTDFTEIFNKEYKNILLFDDTNESNVNTNIEYFAEAFQEYFICPQQLDYNCPLTYQYIKEIIMEVDKNVEH